MSTYIVATHESTETRDWLCKSCHAYGFVTVTAKGEGERRLWWSRDKAADGAHAEAAEALEKDAQRIVSLIRCPSCRSRAPGATLATLWYGLKDIAVAVTSSVTLGIVLWAASDSSLLGILALVVAFIVLIAIGDETRRWREAGRVVVQVANARRSQQSIASSAASSAPIAPAPRQAPRPAEPAGPFRSVPSSPIIATEKPTIPTSVPIVQHDPSAEQPTFLR